MTLFSEFFQIINFIISLYCSIYGIKYYKYLNKSKILIFLPISSTIQIVFIEIFKSIYKTVYKVGLIEYLSVLVYLVIETIVILVFFYRTSKSLLLNRIIWSTAVISLIVISFDLFRYTQKNEKDFSYQIFEGFAIEILSFIFIAKLFFKGKIENIYIESKNLFTIGIFFGFIIIAPFSMLQNFLTSKGGILYSISFIANTFGYSTMFIFFILGIYVSRKPNTI